MCNYSFFWNVTCIDLIIRLASAVKLPKASDIPNVNLEVCNYHHPVLGTFHAKYMVVDRKIAVINSNNVQDR